MSHNIQSAVNLDLIDQIVNTKSDEVLKASLSKLRAILDMIGEEEAATKEGGTAPSKSIVNDVLSKLGPVLDDYMQTDPVKAHTLIASLASMLEEYAEGSGEKVSEIVAAIAPAIKNYLATNPNEFMDVIQLIAPLIRKNSGSLANQIALAKVAFLQYEIGSVGVDSATFTQVVGEKVLPALAKGLESATALEGMYKEIRPTLEKLYAKDPSKMQAFLIELDPILGEIAIQNPLRLSAIVENKGLEKAYDSSFANIRNKLGALGKDDPLNLRESLGTAMLFIQKFQISLSKAQASQDKITAAIGVAMITSAQAMQKSIDAKIAEIEAQEKAAQDRPWWEWLVIGVVAVLGAVIAGLTAGLGAALVAVAIGAFMASPLFNMTTQAIAGAFKPMLIKIYEDEGMSKTDATEKASAVANIIAKVIVTVAVIVVSCGAGGITAAAEEGADTAVTAGAEEGAEAGAEEGGESAGTSAGKAGNNGAKYTYSLSRGMKMAALEGLSTLTASNIWMDAMMTNPEWVKKHQTLAIILDVIAEVVGMVASIYAGVRLFSSMSEVANTLETLPKGFRAIFPLSFSAQAGQGAMESYFAGKSAEYLDEASETMRLVGQLEGKLSRKLAVADSMTETQGVNDKSALTITKAMGKEMSSLEEDSGKAWATTARILAR